jgi:3-oxoacyl-[acyl-carrier protein] reductase
MLPGQFDTERLRSIHEKFAVRLSQSPEEQRETAPNAIPAARFGTPDEFGATCVFHCSAHAR